MYKITKVFVISIAIILSTGCASMSKPKRTAYTGADSVGAATPEMLIGNWSVKALNPAEGENTTESKASFKSDGTVTINVTPNTSPNPMGTIALEMTGDWSIEGDYVVQQLKSIRETSGNKMASMIVGMMGSMKEKMGGKSNIYEASADRVVFVSDDGQAQELIRIQ
jgi:hypothetical protein